MKVIAQRLGVSPGTVHLWTRDIEVAPQHALRNMHQSRSAAVEAWAEKNRARRRGYQREGRRRAREGDRLHLAGCMLYWAEGSKSKNSAKIANSDVHLVRFFRKFLSECFDVPADRFTLRLNVYLGNGLTIDAVERYWLDALDLPRTVLRKHAVNHFPTSSSGRKRNHLPFGVCTLGVNDTRVVQHIFGAIQEYGGFDQPKWLDCRPTATPE